jgi:hypothetical protein
MTTNTTVNITGRAQLTSPSGRRGAKSRSGILQPLWRVDVLFQATIMPVT